MTHHDRNTPTVGGALIAPANLRAICEARQTALTIIEDAAAALEDAYARADEAATVAKAAHGGWHSPRTDRDEEKTRGALFRGRYAAAASVAAYRADLDAAIWTRLLEESGLRRIMDAKERDDMDTALRADVPPATIENITATVERLMGDSEPPFAGTHWMKHVRHAWDFLKPVDSSGICPFGPIFDLFYSGMCPFQGKRPFMTGAAKGRAEPFSTNAARLMNGSSR